MEEPHGRLRRHSEHILACASHAACWARAFNKGFSVTKEPSKELRDAGQPPARASHGRAPRLRCERHDW